MSKSMIDPRALEVIWHSYVLIVKESNIIDILPVTEPKKEVECKTKQ